VLRVDFSFIMKLSLSLLLGLLIGIDRQLKHKPLGMKTSMVISVASCLLTIISIKSVQYFSVPGHTMMDPMRLAAQIVSGIGFIGAGTIIVRRNEVITGLTTAAMVWAAAAVGVAVGAGFFEEAAIAVVLIIIAIHALPFAIKQFGPRKLNERDLSVKLVVSRTDELSRLQQLTQEYFRIKHMKVQDLNEENQQIQMIVTAPEDRRTTDMYYALKKLAHVVTVEVEHI
jgi:putative Mg2+ transporter-C (MgtC) family protein